METKRYNIYPSLLTAYQNLLDYQLIAEEDWNKVTEAAHQRGEYLDSEIGDYKLTPDDMYLKLEADLINSINRVERKPNEAADKGTAFNEVVDCLIEHRKSAREDCIIESAVNNSGIKVIRASINNFCFDFDIELCRLTAEQFKGALTQYLIEADMDTCYGVAHLYGYMDYWLGDKIIDVKTTSRYTWPKYDKGWQRYIYPWCAIESGQATSVESFMYWVVEWAYQASGMPVTAKGIYKEEYDYNHHEAGIKIRGHVESFIDWLENRKEFIQDKRIFGGVNPGYWYGRPVDAEALSLAIYET